MNKQVKYQEQPQIRIVKEFFAVRIDGVNGSGLALNGSGGYSLFGNRQNAKKFCDELQEHLESRCSVIRIEATFIQLLK